MKDWLDILLRSAALFFLSIVFIRILGKRNVAKMTPFQFVNYTVIALITALISVKMITNLAFGFIALGVWIILSLALDYLSLKSKLFHDVINGKETILIKQGKVMEENLSQVRLTGEELLRELRTKNVFNLADVEFAIMETTGDINVLLKSDKKPVTSYDLGRKVAPQSEPQTVILDGNILNEPLANLGLNQQWLNMQLENMGLSLDNVFIGQVDSSGDLYVDLFDDAIQLPQPKVKEMLYANLEKAQADLITFSLETENKYAKMMYSQDADKLKMVIESLEPYLLR
ncbi:DUF421 domain-containing protein [Petroclostridium sp. X23]|uniref:DUF421 domain-containing protein n=1 Tax=Petroclostridium sp. X23 TaxID=3045146 RepID=UPI0024ADFCB2|nr:DUF421 domain-containing protein [Petroclostridium sp. X23]WHH60168.1 DUF421 domain-containing protein [Petroclostridium sp. X23]